MIGTMETVARINFAIFVVGVDLVALGFYALWRWWRELKATETGGGSATIVYPD